MSVYIYICIIEHQKKYIYIYTTWYVPPPSNSCSRFTLGRSCALRLSCSLLSLRDTTTKAEWYFAGSSLWLSWWDVYWKYSLSAPRRCGLRRCWLWNKPLVQVAVDSTPPPPPPPPTLHGQGFLLHPRPKPRIIFWFLKWETGMLTLLHHIGWIKCPSAHSH